MQYIRVFTQALQEVKPAILLFNVLLLVLIGGCLAVLYYQDMVLWGLVKYFAPTVGLFFLLAILYYILKVIFKDYLR
jgi:hypothetical protein